MKKLSPAPLIQSSAPHRLAALLWRHKFITGLALFILAAWLHGRVTGLTDNPSATKKHIVRGEFPYDRGLELRIQVSYYTKNPICRQTAFVFFIVPQATVTGEGWRTLSVVREEGNRFRFEFFEDAVVPGFCEWELKFVNYVIQRNQKEVQGAAILGFPNRYNTIRYACKDVTLRWHKTDGTRVDDTNVVCLPGNDRQYDPAKTEHQIDFIWEQKKS